MNATFSIPDAFAYGENEPVPAIAGLPSERVAIANLVHKFPGGVAALAKRVGMSQNTLQHKSNLNNDTHHLTVAELLRLQRVSGDMVVTQALAAAEGYTCISILPVAPSSIADGLTRTMVGLAEFAESVRDATEGGRPVTRTKVRRVDHSLGELLGAANALAALVRAGVVASEREA